MFFHGYDDFGGRPRALPLAGDALGRPGTRGGGPAGPGVEISHCVLFLGLATLEQGLGV